jgi:hypothetical protein
MLSKMFPFALYTSPLPVQALQSRSCLSYLSCAKTASLAMGAYATVFMLTHRRTDRKFPEVQYGSFIKALKKKCTRNKQAAQTPNRY